MKDDIDLDGYISLSKYASLNSVTPNAVRALIYRGRLEAIKIGNNYFIDANTVYPKRSEYKRTIEGYVCVKDYAKTHYMTEGNVRKLIRNGRLPAIRDGVYYFIAEDEPSPERKRKEKRT